jgi:P pilus assembly chaperone PapD
MNQRLQVMLLVLLLSGASVSAFAMGDLMVAPTRVILEGRSRSAEISLIHRGQEPATYRIGFVELEMDERGGMREREAGADSAAALIRFSPRQVTLEPGQVQTVRLQLRKPADLAAGEYRSHLTFRHVPDELPAVDSGAGLAVALVPVYGVSIPVIVRHAVTGPGTLEIASAVLVEIAAAGSDVPRPALRVAIRRSAETSAYFDLEVEAVGTKASEASLGRVRGLAIYSSSPVRVVDVPLTSIREQALVKLIDRESPGRRVLLEQIVVLDGPARRE